MSTKGGSLKGGLGACYPRKIRNFDTLKSYSCVWRGRFLSKTFAKSIVFNAFFCVFSHTSTQFYFIFQAVYLSFRGISFKYTLLRVLVYFIIRIHLKTSNRQMSGFFLSRSHIGQDLGFSSKIERIPTTQDGWTIC